MVGGKQDITLEERTSSGDNRFFSRPLQIARKADLKTDALDQIKKVEKLSRTKGDRRDMTRRSMDLCTQNGDYYAVLAVCHQVLNSPAYAGMR